MLQVTASRLLLACLLKTGKTGILSCTFCTPTLLTAARLLRQTDPELTKMNVREDVQLHLMKR